jgi:hypothetical protein
MSRPSLKKRDRTKERLYTTLAKYIAVQRKKPGCPGENSLSLKTMPPPFNHLETRATTTFYYSPLLDQFLY